MEPLPREFGRYTLTELIGAGGMAEVYRAETLPVAGITKPVAIKCLLPGTERDEEVRGMLLDEARIWVRLQHPNIVHVVEFGEAEHRWFLALELIEGVTASDLVNLTGPLSVPEALCVVERVAKALSYAHSLSAEGRPLGIVHRDVKPANILVSTRGEVKLTDFGIARATDRVTRTMSGIVKGSLHFLSPEQARGDQVDARSDLFSLGCTLHKLLTGQPLLGEIPQSALLVAVARGQIPPPAASLPGPVRELIASLTAADPRVRPDGAETAKVIRSLLAPEVCEDYEPKLGERVVAARRKMAEKAGERPPPVDTRVITAAAEAPPRAIPARARPVRRSEPMSRAATVATSLPGRLAEITISGARAVAAAPRTVSPIALTAFGLAVLVLAVLLVPPVMGSLKRSSCLARRTGVARVLLGSGPREAAASARNYVGTCPSDPDAGTMVPRLLALDGDLPGALAALPPEHARSLSDRWAAAAIAFAGRDFKGAEEGAWTASRAAARDGKASFDLQCLAAAAALDGDHPERVEGYLAGAAGDCVTLLRAAALAQNGARGQALALLSRANPQAHDQAAFETALGILHLHGGDMERAAADAKTASAALDDDPLLPRPYLWFEVQSPRGEGAIALRVSGPFDDPGIYTRILEGDAARGRGNFDLAAKLYQAAVDRQGRVSIAEVRLAEVMAKQGRPQLSRAHLTRALELDSQNATALVELALIEEVEPGMLAQAISHAAAALALEPENRDARRIAARRAQ